MKHRYGWMLAMMGAALFLAGCATTDTAVVPPSPARNYKLTVVESSPQRTLSPQETEQLRTQVLQYLLTQGPVRDDTYTVRVDLPTEVLGAEPQYLVVQLTAEAPPSYTVITHNTDPWYYDPYYMGYGYFGLLGYSYYNQFYYNHNHYYRPIPPPAHYPRPHPPGTGQPNPGGHYYPDSTKPGVAHQRPKDGNGNPGNNHYPKPANPEMTGKQPFKPGAQRTPNTNVTQRNDPGRRSDGKPAPGLPPPVTRPDYSRGGGGQSRPAPSYSPPPARESAPIRETAQSNQTSSAKGDLRPEQQEK